LLAFVLRLTSLKTLDIEGCHTLQELPVTSMMTCLTSLTLDDCGLKELPGFGGMTALHM